MVMNERRVTVEIEYSDCTVTVRTGLSGEGAAGIVRRLEGEADVTVTISQEGIDETLRVAVDCAWAFLGAERPGEVLQYVADADELLETQPFVIGHQEVDMESKYITPVAAAADVVEEWLKSGEASSLGYWEPQ
jgi:hypothetical protein